MEMGIKRVENIRGPKISEAGLKNGVQGIANIPDRRILMCNSYPMILYLERLARPASI